MYVRFCLTCLIRSSIWETNGAERPCLHLRLAVIHTMYCRMADKPECRYIIIVIYVVFSAWRLLLPGFKCEYYLFPPPYRFRSPVVGEFTAPVRNLLIEFVGPDLNDQLIAIGSEQPNVPPVAAGFIIPVRIRTSGGMCLYTYVCIIHLHVHICASVTLRSMF